MGRRSTKGQGALIFLLIVIGVPVYVISQFAERFGGGVVVAVSVGIIVLVLVIRGIIQAKERAALAAALAARKAALLAKYRDPEIVDRIIGKIIWVGEHENQLTDSLGNPVDTDQKVLKTKSKVIWKYHHQGGNRYGLRITVENGEVVGWDEKL